MDICSENSPSMVRFQTKDALWYLTGIEHFNVGLDMAAQTEHTGSSAGQGIGIDHASKIQIRAALIMNSKASSLQYR